MSSTIAGAQMLPLLQPSWILRAMVYVSVQFVCRYYRVDSVIVFTASPIVQGIYVWLGVDLKRIN